MNLAQRIILAVAVAGILYVVAAHATEYVQFKVDGHASLMVHAIQIVLAAVWGAIGFTLLSDRR